MRFGGQACAALVGLVLYVAASSALAAPAATVTLRMVAADGRVTTITRDVDPVTFDHLLAAPDPHAQGSDPPGAPGQPSLQDGPGISPETTRVDIHQEDNGWQRDTRFERNVPFVDGRPQPGAWRIVRDLREFLGCARIPASCSQL